MKRSIATLLLMLLAASTALAASVDIALNPMFTESPTWDWCSGASCNKTTYVKVQNLGGVSTIAHLYVGTPDTGCHLEISRVYTVNCSTGLPISEVTSSLADVGGSYSDLGGEVWPEAFRAPQRNLSASATLCWRVDFGFGTPYVHADYEDENGGNCDYTIQVKPKSTDTDVDDTEHYNPYVNHQRSLGWELL